MLTLDFQLLATLRTTSSVFPPRPGIKVLDDILAAARAARFAEAQAEPAVDQAVHRLSGESLPRRDDYQELSFKYVPPIIEIRAAGPAEGRTQLLYCVAAKLLLHQSCDTTLQDVESGATSTHAPLYTESRLDRPGGHVVWIDCSYRLDILRLRDVMLHEASKSLPETVPPYKNLQSAVSSALECLHVFRPQTSSQLLTTVRKLESYIIDLQDQTGDDIGVGAIIVSDLTSFYWEDRQHEEEEKAGAYHSRHFKPADAAKVGEASTLPQESPTHKRSVLFSVRSHHASLALLLSRIATDFLCPLLVSTLTFSSIAPAQTASGEPSPVPHPTLRSPLPSPWARYVNIEIIVEKERKWERIPKGTTLEQALQIQRARAKAEGALKRDLVKAWVDARKWLSACSFQAIDAGELDRLAMVNFQMSITERGVDISSRYGLAIGSQPS